MWIINIIAFLVILSVLIVTHEFGHFLAARMGGIKVEKFSIGFGPPIFKKKNKDTLFLICAIPLGGYVKMAGDERNSCEHKDYEFFSKPAGIRARVVFFGPFFNYLFSFLIIWLLFMIGMPKTTTTVGWLAKGAPAQKAGLEKGDRILKINNTKIKRWDDIEKAIASSNGSIVITALRREREQKFTIIPKEQNLKDIFGRNIRRRIIGVYPRFVIAKHNLFSAFFEGAKYTLNITFLILKGFYYIIVGSVPLQKSVAGPVKLYAITADALRLGIIPLLNLISFIGISLAVINLFPIPVLDGGHLFFIGLEKIRGKPLNEKTEAVLTQIGIVILSLIMVFAFYNDIAGMITHR